MIDLTSKNHRILGYYCQLIIFGRYSNLNKMFVDELGVKFKNTLMDAIKANMQTKMTFCKAHLLLL